ncbi:hypothetical protein MTO96_010944 [Rhipicephalus appendiculatus]
MRWGTASTSSACSFSLPPFRCTFTAAYWSSISYRATWTTGADRRPTGPCPSQNGGTRPSPLEADGRPSRCTVYKYPGDPNDTDVTACDHWDYDPKNKKRTVVSTWNLVCRRRVIIGLVQVVQLAGFVLLPSIAGYMMDRVGRRPILLLSTAALIVSTCGGCFANTLALYVTIRFLNTACVGTGCRGILHTGV